MCWGFDVDWDSFDYVFNVTNFDWNPYIGDKRTNEELMELLIQAAIKEHDEEHDTKLESAKYAIDAISSAQEPKLYQAKVCKYREEITVVLFCYCKLD
ncbi:unnamed protein product [Thlaspi arvense]|uniref:Uncharacterized protein n=1 Tax=Thlaspi arvense TaxID=13288 RepID=A0AAU9T6Z3_THLAR|nr:unnamed protein product [Thlaspi arvense]